MQRIGELVRVDANETALHAVQVRVDILYIPLRTRYAEVFREQRLHVLNEGPAAAHSYLNEQRLTLLESHAAITADRLVTPLLGQP
jgi:hypothetical protein